MSPARRKRELTEFVGVRMSSALRTALDMLAKDNRRDLSEFIRLILEDYVQAKRDRKRK